MIQAFALWLARLCIWVVGLPAVSLECRKAEARKHAAGVLGLYVGSITGDDDDDGGCDEGCDCGAGVEARGIGFHVDHDDEDEEDGE